MEISWSNLTCNHDWYSFTYVHTKGRDTFKTIITFKFKGLEAKVYVIFEEIARYNICRAVSVEKVESENPKLKKFLENGEDTLIAICNVYRHAWIAGKDF